MNHLDHPLLTEAWRKVDEFEADVRNEQLLAPYRSAHDRRWRERVARSLVKLAGRLEPTLNPSSTRSCADCP